MGLFKAWPSDTLCIDNSSQGLRLGQYPPVCPGCFFYALKFHVINACCACPQNRARVHVFCSVYPGKVNLYFLQRTFYIWKNVLDFIADYDRILVEEEPEYFKLKTFAYTNYCIFLRRYSNSSLPKVASFQPFGYRSTPSLHTHTHAQDTDFITEACYVLKDE